MESNEFIDILRVGLILGGAFLFVVLLVGWIVWWNKRAARQKRERDRNAFEEAFPARARIVEVRRAGAQRSDEFTLFKVLLEVMPADSQPAFSAVVVLEVEPPALPAMQPNVVLPVRVDRQNLRRVFPEIPGARYSETYQHAFLGIENDFQPAPAIAAAGIAPHAPKEHTIYRKRSNVRVFGLPLWEIAFNLIRKKGSVRHVRQAKARAIFAVGDSASGVIAVGSFAKGVVSIGLFGIGILNIGLGGFGVVAIGAMPFGLLALGALSVGLVSFGAITAGFASVGFLTVSPYAFSLDGRSAELMPFYNVLKNLAGLSDAGMRMLVEYGLTTIAVAAFAFFLVWMIGGALLVKFLEPNDNRLDSPRSL